jgi:YD repeat-containing protein
MESGAINVARRSAVRASAVSHVLPSPITFYKSLAPKPYNSPKRGTGLSAWIGLKLLIFFLVMMCSMTQARADVQYVYDEVGRLVEAIDPSGNSVLYSYDAAGNITAIQRINAGQLSVAEFTPDAGPVGTTVTIYGVGFNATATNDIVKFNGTQATVNAASSTQLSAVVPSGATTGPISVTVDTATATSAQDFTVTAGPVNPPPLITSFTPTIGTVGTPVTITGQNFDPAPGNNFVKFNVISGAAVTGSTTTQIQAKVPNGATSGPIHVRTPYGSTTSSADFFAAPAGYTTAQIGTTGRITVDGASVSFNSGAAGNITLILFNGVQGQNLGLGIGPATFTPAGGSATLYIKTPTGTDLIAGQTFSAATSFDLTKLPATGTYTIIVVPGASNALNATFTLSNDVAGTLVANAAPLTFATTRVGQNGRYTFSGTAGQNVSVGWSGSTFAGAWSYLYVYKPDGTQLAYALFDNGANGKGNGTLALANLPATGTYTVFVTPFGASTGQVKLALNATGSINVDDMPSTFSLLAGQNGYYTFSGSAGQLLGLGVSGVSSTPSGAQINVSVLKPDGSFLTFPGGDWVGTAGTSFDLTLPSTGTYTIVVTPSGASAANFTLTLSNDVAGGTLATNAAPLTFNTTRVGQNARYTFSGTAGQNLSVAWSGSTFGLCLVNVFSPDGTSLGGDNVNSVVGGARELANLPATGTYTVFVSARDGSTGQITIGLNATGSITVDGVPSTFSIVAGQNGYYTFSGSAGQNVGLGVSGVSTTPTGTDFLYIQVLNPNGSILAGCDSRSAGISCDLTLPTAGTYTVVVDSFWSSVANFTLTLSNDVMGTLTTKKRTFSTTRVGQNARYTFSGTAGQNLNVVWSGSTFAGVWSYLYVFAPDGTLFADTYFDNGIYGRASGTLALTNLPATGTYTVLVKPYGTSTGQVTLNLSSH